MGPPGPPVLRWGGAAQGEDLFHPRPSVANNLHGEPGWPVGLAGCPTRGTAPTTFKDSVKWSGRTRNQVFTIQHR